MFERKLRTLWLFFQPKPKNKPDAIDNHTQEVSLPERLQFEPDLDRVLIQAGPLYFTSAGSCAVHFGNEAAA